ncbi:hypothetical protein [Prochlorococcus sp. MIT 1223]|uniref:hypothetical protein n=1 Tax=Prochlorococcus sp. MIT 1223 TaxID=3096217 RepID=UPI002A7655FB|nr:hypothetical protein [Prochlorococcus sp. MIT 1223]
MNRNTQLMNIGIPALLGIGAAWLGIAFIKSAPRLEVRKMELEIQLGSKKLLR